MFTNKRCSRILILVIFLAIPGGMYSLHGQTGNVTGTMFQADDTASTQKSGFYVGVVEGYKLEQVPAVDPVSSIRGKLPGVRIINPSGAPSVSPQIRLRGSNSIVGDQSPLILVDGTFAFGNFLDMNPEDIARVEVIKGSAGSAFYGSLGGNGVVHFITKRGDYSKEKPTTITIRNEFGKSFLNSDYPLTKHHYWKMDPATGRRNKDWIDIEYINNPANAADSANLRFQKLVADNDYSVLYDHIEEVYQPQSCYSNYVSVSHHSDIFQLYTSFGNKEFSGIVPTSGSMSRKSFRFNVDLIPYPKLNLSVSSSYSSTESSNPVERDQDQNIHYSVLMLEPNITTKETSEPGEYVNQFEDPWMNSYYNPIFYLKQEWDDDTDRRYLSGSIKLRYKILDWLTLDGQYAIDRIDDDYEYYIPVGFRSPGMFEPSISGGSYRIDRSIDQYQSGLIGVQGNRDFGKLNARLGIQYLFEKRHHEGLSGSGSRFTSRGVKTLDAVDPDYVDNSSFVYDYEAENFITELGIAFDEKIYFNGLANRNGSSQFGRDVRFVTFYRAAVNYVLSEDIAIPFIPRLNIWAAYGTSGQRPGFSAQYGTYYVGLAGISPGILENRKLKPSILEALEGGIEINFLSDYLFSVTYENTKAKDQILQVPLSGVTGYSSQWQNAGTMHTTALELNIEGQPFKGNFRWNFGITWDKITQEITDLNRTPWTAGTGATALYRIEEGEPYGIMYGNVLCKSLDDLTLDVNGHVMNDYNYDPDVPAANLTIDDFEVNNEGYVILKGTEGSRAEQVHYRVDENGEVIEGKIGDSNPDFCFSFYNQLFYRNFTLYFLFEGQVGGDIYNYTRQMLNFDDRHGDSERYARMGKSVDYHNGTSKLYNRSDPNDYYVEDGGYLKLREIAFSYTLQGERIRMDFLQDITLGLTARNLLTFTDYTGWDPEVSYSGNATNFRVDEFTYPHFATWSLFLTVNF